MTPSPLPRVVVLAAPSGGGKTTIARELLRRSPDAFGYSVSATTRKPRAGEKNGEAYYFLTRDEFRRRVEAGEFLEWAEYAGELYGTLKGEVERVLASGRNVVLDIEVKGARQVRAVYPRPASVSIFMIPPSPDALIARLRKRRTESDRELRERLAIAVHEVQAAEEDVKDAIVFDHIVVNDVLEETVKRVIAIVEKPDVVKHRTMDMVHVLAEFVRKLEHEAYELGQSVKRSR